uniref:Uncharacterized protein n=1 Tax=Opuntia streptacantha TaxID=393608 RepID=A0A7C8ZPK7_OPUST
MLNGTKLTFWWHTASSELGRLREKREKEHDWRTLGELFDGIIGISEGKKCNILGQKLKAKDELGFLKLGEVVWRGERKWRIEWRDGHENGNGGTQAMNG